MFWIYLFKNSLHLQIIFIIVHFVHIFNCALVEPKNQNTPLSTIHLEFDSLKGPIQNGKQLSLYFIFQFVELKVMISNSAFSVFAIIPLFYF